MIFAALFLILFSHSAQTVSSSPAASSKIYLPLVTNNSTNGPTLGGCPMFPANNVWNARVDSLPVDSHSATYINFIGASTTLHPDFGSAYWAGGPIGIPYATVPSTQTAVAINYIEFGSESDPGPFPIPPTAPVEYGGDHHVLIVQRGACYLYELYHAALLPNASWNAGSGAKYNLNSNALRPAGWTSADAAGLPMLPGLARYDEVAAGEIRHAIRFTVRDTNGTYIWPARHLTGCDPANCATAPPMGQRFRLKSSFNISTFSRDTQVILTAFKRYGIIIADNGSDWYIGGAPDARWDDGTLVDEFNLVHGSDFEAVDESSLMLDPNSGQVK